MNRWRAFAAIIGLCAGSLTSRDCQAGPPGDPVGDWAERLPSRNVSVRMEAICELGKLGPKSAPAVPAIADRLQNDPDARVRLAAAGTLGAIGAKAKDAVPALVGALTDEGHDVASWSASALGKIGPAARDAVPALTKMLGSSYSSRVYCATRALGDIGPDAKSAVPELVRMAEGQSWTRAEAAEALWRIDRNAIAIPALIKHLRDPKCLDRGSAAEALGRLGSDAKAAVPALLAALEDDQGLVAVRSAEALWYVARHEAAIRALVKGLGHPDATERYHAAARLGRIGPEARAAIPALTAALKDAGPWVAPAAAEALRRIDPVAARKAGAK